jgi:hypothetical protein
MSRPRLRHRSRASRTTIALPPGSLASILPLPLLMGGCASDEDELPATVDFALPA